MNSVTVSQIQFEKNNFPGRYCYCASVTTCSDDHSTVWYKRNTDWLKERQQVKVKSIVTELQLKLCLLSQRIINGMERNLKKNDCDQCLRHIMNEHAWKWKWTVIWTKGQLICCAWAGCNSSLGIVCCCVLLHRCNPARMAAANEVFR